MKKVLSIIALAAVFTACSNSETVEVKNDTVTAVDTTITINTEGVVVDTTVTPVVAPAAH